MKTYASTLLFILILRVGLLSAQTASPTIPPASFVEVDGSRLYYEECGTGPKAVVLLHDGVVNSAIWYDVWPTFCKRAYKILTLSSQGTTLPASTFGGFSRLPLKTISTTICRCRRSQPFRMCRTFECLR